MWRALAAAGETLPLFLFARIPGAAFAVASIPFFIWLHFKMLEDYSTIGNPIF